MDALILYFVALLGLAFSFLAVYADNPPILGFAGLFFLFLGLAVITSPVTVAKALVLTNTVNNTTTSTVTTLNVEVSFPYREPLGLMFVLFGILELYSAVFSSRRGE